MELYNKNITEEECNTHNWEVLYGVDMNTMISEFHEKYMHSYGEAKVVDDAKNIIDEPATVKGSFLSYMSLLKRREDDKMR